MKGKAWSASTLHFSSFSNAGKTSPFMTSPHLPPQVVILSVAACAFATWGAATSAAAEPRSVRRVRVDAMADPPGVLLLNLHRRAQSDKPVDGEHDGEREQDRDHGGGGDRAVKVELHVVEHHDRQTLAVRRHEEERDRELIEGDDEGEDAAGDDARPDQRE